MWKEAEINDKVMWAEKQSVRDNGKCRNDSFHPPVNGWWVHEGGMHSFLKYTKDEGSQSLASMKGCLNPHHYVRSD